MLSPITLFRRRGAAAYASEYMLQLPVVFAYMFLLPAAAVQRHMAPAASAHMR